MPVTVLQESVHLSDCLHVVVYTSPVVIIVSKYMSTFSFETPWRKCSLENVTQEGNG